MGKRAIVLLIALLLGGAAGFAVLQFLEGAKLEAEDARAATKVFRAATGIPEGAEGSVILQTDQVVEGKEQKEDLPDGAITRPEDLEAVLRGKVAVGPINNNEIITASQWVALSTEITPMRDLIPDGLQAMTMSPGEVQGVNGFIEPGDKVNVMVTLDIEALLTEQNNTPDFGIPTETQQTEDGTDQVVSQVIPYTRFVLQNIEVLAAGRDVVSRDTETQVVAGDAEGSTESGEDLGGNVQGDAVQEVVSIYTLAVDADQAEKLVYAIENGSVYLTLVKEDFEAVATRGVTIETLFETADLTADIFN